MGIEEINKAWGEIDFNALVEELQKHCIAGYPITPDTKNQRFVVGCGNTQFHVFLHSNQHKLIGVDLMQDWNCKTSWAIPYKGKLTAPKMIKAIKDCINIYMTEEIEGVDYS
jgi:hypothetical protein